MDQLPEPDRRLDEVPPAVLRGFRGSLARRLMSAIRATNHHSPNRRGTSAEDLRKSTMPAFFSRYAVVVFLVALLLAFSAALPKTFFTVGNFDTILNSNAVLLILALGLTIPLCVGEFDLSVAAMLGFGAMLVPYLATDLHLGMAIAIVCTLVIGVTVGVTNGFVVLALGVNAFIATLGTSTVLGGLTLLISGGQVLSGVPTQLQAFANIQIVGFSSVLIAAAVLVLLLWYLYEYTPLGRYLYFIGENAQVARLTGLNVNGLKWSAFVAAGLVSAICGILAAAQLGSADPALGPPYLLPAYAAAFLGATTIKPGRFNSWGTVIGLYLLVTGTTGLELMGAASWVGQVFDGGALILAVAFARWTAREQIAVK